MSSNEDQHEKINAAGAPVEYPLPTKVYVPHTVRSVRLVGGRLEVVRQYPSGMAYCSGESCPDRVEKEIYEAKDGRIELTQVVAGRHEPAKLVPETITFDN